MFVTLHLVDGRKITKERENLIVLQPQSMFTPDIEQGKIIINWQNVVDMRPAEDYEIEHAKINGW